jgi:hypothetical protein
MKSILRKHKKILALVLSLVMCTGLVGSVPLAAYADSDSSGDVWLDAEGNARELERIEVGSAADLVEVSKKCHVDSWSSDKLIVLTRDIDISGSGFETFPIFNGVFDGNGHIISGYGYNGEGYVVGLFRYVGETGVVANLTIKGSVSTSDEQQCIGGLCGVNSGLITNCTFQGIVTGKTETGAIVGINESTGTIYKCTSVGKVTGYYYTGGIAGKNYGTIDGCENTARINDSTEWVEEDDKLTAGLLQNITENESDVKVQSGVDTGGIAGYSKGLVISCINSSTVGYKRTGYNVGGIVGRQSGLVTLCTNAGTVYGRKDVGGIVGQLEPYIELNEAESIKEAMDKLHDLIEKTLDDMSAGSNALKGDMDSLKAYADSALDVSDALGDNLKQYVNDNTDQLNYAAERLEHVMDLLPAVMDNTDAASDSLSELNDALKKLNDDLNISDRVQNSEYNEADHRRLSLNAGVGGYITSSSASPSENDDVTITVYANNGYQINPNNISIVDANGSKITATSASGSPYKYTLTFRMPSPNVVVSAVFDCIGAFTPTSDAGGKVTVSKSGDDGDYTITVRAHDGYTLPSSVDVGGTAVPLTVDASNGSATATVSRGNYPMGAPVIVNAAFSGAPYVAATNPGDEHVITTLAGTGGTVTAVTSSGDTGKANSNDTIYVTCTADGSYRLKKLVVDGREVSYDQSAKRYEFTMPDSDVVITAEYEPVLLMVSSNAGGSATYSGDGDKVTLSVTPNSGYELGTTPAVTDANGNAIAVGKASAGSNSYEFKLNSSQEPARAVITFKRQNQQDAVDSALDEIQSNADQLNDQSAKMEDEVTAIRNIMDGREWSSLSTKEKNSIIDHVVNLLEYSSNSLASASSIASNLATITSVYAPYIKDASSDANDDLNTASDKVKDTIDSLDAASTGLRNIVDYLNAQSDLHFSKINDELEKNVDDFRDNLRGMSNAVGNLSDHASDYSELVNNDLRAVNDQLNVVFDLLVDRYVDIQTSDGEEEIFDDVSEEELEQATTGRVDNCINKGSVNGDIDIGGIAGSMSIDEEDPEQNAAGDVDIQLGGKYTTKCIIADCSNQGFVTSKKNGAGGIVGFMNYGICIDCKSLGMVTSTDNDYVGGIAGQSLTIIRDCYSLATLSGHKNVGGIAGYGTTITGCYSMPTLISADGRMGAIAGLVATQEDNPGTYSGTVSGNYYVSDDMYGIDDISYVGVAEPLTYQELLEIEDLPNDFRHLRVMFKIDDTYLGSQELEFGDSLSKVKFPTIPTESGQYGHWPDVSGMTMTSNLVIEGEYMDDVTVVESDDTTTVTVGKNQEQTKASVLVEGRFTSDARLIVEKDTYTVESSLVENREYVTYAIQLENAETDGGTVELRLFNPYDKAQVLVLADGGWEKINSKSRGQYLQVELSGTSSVYCVVNTEFNWVVIAFAAAIVVILLAAVILAVRIGVKRRSDTAKDGTDGN